MRSKLKPESDLQSLLDGIKELLSSYIQNKLELYKLKTYEKVAVAGSFIGYSLIVVLTLFNILLLVLITAGLFLGQLLHNMAAGFGILIAFSVLVLLLFMSCRKRFRKKINNLIVGVIHKVEEDEE